MFNSLKIRSRSKTSLIISISYWKGRFSQHVPLFTLFFSSLLLRVRASRSQVHQELREREDVEKELGLVKGWIQDTRGLLLSPTADLESLLQELEVGYNAVKTGLNYA